MSSLTIGGKSLVIHVAETPGKPCGRIQDVPEDCFFRFFNFLTLAELALAERVDRTWRKMINPEDQALWKEQCSTHKIVVVSPYIEQAIGSYSSVNANGALDVKILSLITEYDAAGVNYKEQATIPHGRIQFHSDSWQIHDQNKYAFESVCGMWGNDQPEPFACIQVFSPIANPRNGKEELNGRSWYANPPDGVQRLPSSVPLRLFINKDGSYKNNGDRVYIVWKGKRLILTCTHRLEHLDARTPISSFREATAQRITIGLKCGHFKPDSLQRAKDIAALSDTWIDSK